MASIICGRCSRVVDTHGDSVRQCPFCGSTLDNALDSTGFKLATSELPRDASPVVELPPTEIQPADERPRTLGKYVLLRELGSGGFGMVYLARDPDLNILVAIKVPRLPLAGRSQARNRFLREVRAAAKLRQHPNIVTIYSVEREGDVDFIVCQYVAGESLGARIKRESLSFLEIATIVANVARAVEFAHSQGIIHRDIKPGNILLDADGRPHLADFGLAKQVTVDETITRDGQFIGTMMYASPEQAVGVQNEAVDFRTDVYSLGVVLYELLAHTRPFRGTAEAVKQQVLNLEPPALRTVNSKIPGDLQTICEAAMVKERDKRYQSAKAVADDLELWLRGEPINRRHVGRIERTWRWCRRNPVTASLLASIAVLLVATTGTSLAMYSVNKKALGFAEEARQAQAEVVQQQAQLLQGEKTLREKIEETLRKDHELLSRAYVERGTQYLNAGPGGTEFNPLKALPWLYAAFELDDKNPERRDAARIRVERLLDFSPRVAQMWFQPGGISAAAIAPGGEVFVTVPRETASNTTANLWRSSKRTPTALIHAAQVIAVAFSPDGMILATGAKDGLRLWDVPTGELRPGFPRKVPCESLRFSDSGLWLASADRKQIEVCEVETGVARGKPMATREATLAGFADSDRLLVTTSLDGSIRSWDIASGTEQKLLQSAPRTAPQAAVAPDGMTIAASAGEGKVRLWDSRSGESLNSTLSHDAATVTQMRYSRDGTLLATFASDGTARVWLPLEGRALWRNNFFIGSNATLDFSDDGSLLAVIHRKRGIAIVDARTGKLAAQPTNAEMRLIAAGWTRDGQTLSATQDGVIRLWDFESREPAFIVPRVTAPIQAVVSDDRQVVAAFDRTGACSVLRVDEEGKFDERLATSFSIIDGADIGALTKDGSIIAVANRFQTQGKVSLYDTTTGQLAAPVIDMAGAIQSLGFGPDSRHLVCQQFTTRPAISVLLSVWDLERETMCCEPIRVDARCNGFDVDNRFGRVAVAAGGQVAIYDPMTCEQAVPPLKHESIVLACRFFDGSQQLATACLDGRAYLWDVETGVCRGATLPDRERINCIDTSPDGSAFVTGSASGQARLWSSQNAHPVSRVMEHGSPDSENQPDLSRVIVDPAGRWITTVTGNPNVASADFQVHGWDANSGELLFARNLRHAHSRFARLGLQESINPSRIATVFISTGGQAVYVVGVDRQFVIIELAPQNRGRAEMRDEIAIRTGLMFEAPGGLTMLQPSNLEQLWRLRGKRQ